MKKNESKKLLLSFLVSLIILIPINLFGQIKICGTEKEYITLDVSKEKKLIINKVFFKIEKDSLQQNLNKKFYIDSAVDPLSKFPCEFSPDCSLLAIGTKSGTVEIWHTSSKNPPFLTYGGGKYHNVLSNSISPVSSLSFNQLGDMLAVGYANGYVALYRATDGALLGKPLKLHSGSVISIDFSHDEVFVASLGDDSILRNDSICKFK
jgi:WD40 repeat protein